MNRRRLRARILAGSTNVRFADMVSLVQGLDLRRARVAGAHHIFVHSDIPGLASLRAVAGQAKPYRIGSFLRPVEGYDLRRRSA